MREELKHGWRRVKLGDVAIERTERVENPADSHFERYVGSDDMDRFDWSVRRWRPSTEVTSAAKVFYPGDFLFVRRSLYASDFRERAARAGFSGVCSGDILPLRERPGAIEAGFLGAVLNHPRIWEYVVKHATGSITRRIKWRDLAEYEFALPPLEEQLRIQRLLTSLACTVDAHRALLDAASELLNAVVAAALWPGTKDAWIGGRLDKVAPPSGWKIVRAETLTSAAVTKGATPSSELSSNGSSGTPFIKVYNLTLDGSLDFSVNPTWISPSGHRELRRSTILPGDVLMNIVGPPMGKVSRVPVGFPESNINQAIVRYRPATTHLGEWLEAYLLSPIAQNWLVRRSKKTSGQRNLTLELCRDLPVPIPEDIETPLSRIRAARECVRVAQSRLDAAQEAATSALTELLRSTNRSSTRPPAVLSEVPDA
jgi:hypothetical protein